MRERNRAVPQNQALPLKHYCAVSSPVGILVLFFVQSTFNLFSYEETFSFKTKKNQAAIEHTHNNCSVWFICNVCTLFYTVHRRIRAVCVCVCVYVDLISMSDV